MKITLPRQRTDARRPRVEVVVPCHNYGRYLPECVASVLAQDNVSTVVTIVDDASTDGSDEVARRLAERHARVRLVQHEENQGAVATFNDGLRRVDAEYVLLLSADDVLSPGALGRATALMEAYPSVGLVYGHARSFSGPTPAWRPARVTWSTWRGEEWLLKQFRRGWNSISSPEAVVRASVQHQVGYYNAALPHTHDVEMWLRIAAVSGVGHVNGVDQAYYRKHEANHSSAFTRGLVSDLDERFKAYDSFLRLAPSSVDTDRLRRILVRRASDELVGLALGAAAAGGRDLASIAEARALAVGIDPSVASRPAWQDLDDLLSGSPTYIGVGFEARQCARDISNRLRWWRWRLVGV